MKPNDGLAWLFLIREVMTGCEHLLYLPKALDQPSYRTYRSRCYGKVLQLLIQAQEFLMIYVCRCLFYSVRNLIYYRDVRNDPASVRGLLQRLEACKERESNGGSGLQAMKDILTEFLLSSLGLTTVDDSKDRIPRGVWLTAAQRDCIAKVSEFGYRAGLR